MKAIKHDNFSNMDLSLVLVLSLDKRRYRAKAKRSNSAHKSLVSISSYSLPTKTKFPHDFIHWEINIFLLKTIYDQLETTLNAYQPRITEMREEARIILH